MRVRSRRSELTRPTRRIMGTSMPHRSATHQILWQALPNRPKRAILPLLCSKFPSRVQISCACSSWGAGHPTGPKGGEAAVLTSHRPLVLAAGPSLALAGPGGSRWPGAAVRPPGRAHWQRSGDTGLWFCLENELTNKCKQAASPGFIRLELRPSCHPSGLSNPSVSQTGHL